jgi:ADP-heptose:LPS heptosyltransferase
MSRKILLKNSQSPGDILMLTAAVRDLKRSHPDWFINVNTSAMELWDNNPYINPLLKEGDPDVEVIAADYPLINMSNFLPYHFIHGFRKFLETKLETTIPQGEFKGDIHLSYMEKSWINQVQELGINEPFWILMAGGKYDFTAKWWNPDNYQKVVDHFKGKLLFVQCGEKSHFHPKLNNVVDFIGKTDIRQFVRLMYHASGAVCPVTFAMHLAAAVETPRNRLINRPCVVLAGGREPTHWEAYPHHRFLHTLGSLNCCDNGGCWKSRCMKVGDGDEKDNKDLCLYPTKLSLQVIMPNKTEKENLYIPKCMDMIKVNHVIEAIESYYPNGF